MTNVRDVESVRCKPAPSHQEGIALTRGPHHTFFGVSLLLFALCATITVSRCASMSKMGAMAMPGDWTMSMAWMRMPGQTWYGAAASFLVMWMVMMLAMMLPALTGMLSRYRRALCAADAPRIDSLAAIAGLAYFGVLTVIGIAAFPLGAALAAAAMHSPALARSFPVAAGAIVVAAGVVQFTAWKAHHLECCRRAPTHERILQAGPGSAWRYGLHLGVHCSYCCAPLTAILLVLGVMDLRAMIVVAVAITAERLLPIGLLFARGVGTSAIIAGLFLISHAIGH